MGKIVDRYELESEIMKLRSDDKTIVTTNGCFDILHIGHKRLLEACAEEGDVLIVLVNSDDSVKAIKGNHRPVIPEQERAELISAFAFVDYVVIFGDETPDLILEDIKPDVHCKGDDYSLGEIPERATVERNDGSVKLIPIVHDRSSTQIVQRLTAQEGVISLDELAALEAVVVDNNHKWGRELIFISDALYTGKFLEYLNNEHAGSLHYHKEKRESFKILSGIVWIVREFRPGDELIIPRGYRHQMKAKTPRAVIMESSTHHEDSDTYREESILR